MSNEYLKPLVVNDGEPVQDLDSIRLFVRAIFHQSEFLDLVEPMSLYVAAHKQLLTSHEVVAEVLKKFFVEALNKSQVWEPKVLSGMQVLSAHIQETFENRTAYTPETRQNPNAVIWPNLAHPEKPRDIFDEMPFAKTYGLIDKQTPIGSAGSCFAMEIAHRFQANGYNYQVTQHHTAQPQSSTNFADSCAAWGIIFNVPAMRQLVEKSFGKRQLPKLLWKIGRNGKTQYRDPFREDIEFESIAEYEAEYDTHLTACREALLRCKTFVMTLGLNEVWTLKTDGAVFSRCPWNFSSSLVRRKVLSVAENLAELQQMLDLWRSYNPELRLILTVSPIPLHGTFRGHEHHVIAANCYSKSTLRVVAEEFVQRNKEVYYFPSYESVMYCTRNPWEKDQRHVTSETVDKVMRLFGKMYIKDGRETFSNTRH